MAGPVEVFGAAAGAVQVGDAALRLSRQIYVFLGELRSAREDIQRLRDTLREADELMRNIVAYIIEWNDASRTREEHRELPASLTRTLTWFTEDLELLRGCLPENLSYAFVDKVKFVFQKSKIKEVTTRLQERKGTANLALSTLGRQSDLRVLNDLGSLKSSLNEIRNSQKAAAQQQTATLVAIQNTSKDYQERLDQLQNASGTHHAAMVTGVRSLSSSAKETVAAKPAYSLTATHVPEDPDQLGRILRAELKQVLEPFSQKIDRRLDAIVESLSRGPSKTMHELARREEEGCHPTAPSSSTDVLVSQHQPRSTEIVLSRDYREVFSRFGVLETRVMRCKARSPVVGITPEAYFRIQVKFSPARWLSSYGLSAIHSTGPNTFGYYDICPSIIPFRVVPWDQEVADTISNDDVSCFRHMLREGRIHWRDEMRGFGYLEIAMARVAPRTWQFLIQNYALDYELDSNSWVVFSFFLRVLSRNSALEEDPKRLREMVQTYLGLDNLIDGLNEIWWLVLALALLESARTFRPVKTAAECLALAETINTGRESMWAFPWFEFSTTHGLPMSEELSRERWFLDLFLARSCDPNKRVTQGVVDWLPLQAALELTTCCLASQHPEEERLLIRALKHRAMGKVGGFAPLFQKKPRLPPCLIVLSKDYFPDGMPDIHKLPHADELGHKWDLSVADDPPEDSGENVDPLILLTPLISAGADVHAILTGGEGEPWGTLTDLAYVLGLERIWSAALEECGYSFDAVKALSRWRLENMQRLKGGSASGVDVGVEPDVSTLRYRRQASVGDED